LALRRRLGDGCRTGRLRRAADWAPDGGGLDRRGVARRARRLARAPLDTVLPGDVGDRGQSDDRRADGDRRGGWLAVVVDQPSVASFVAPCLMIRCAMMLASAGARPSVSTP